MTKSEADRFNQKWIQMILKKLLKLINSNWADYFKKMRVVSNSFLSNRVHKFLRWWEREST